MKHPYEIILELESDNSRLFKESIINRERLASNDELFKGFSAAYNARITFGVKSVPISKSDGPGITFEEFWDIADKLSKRELTGNAARDAIDELMVKATTNQWNDWFRRILIKDMRCGTSESTVNKVVEKENPQYLIPVFSCQLAHDSAKHESKVVGDKLIEVKLDGVRVITIVYPDGRVDQFSRNGKELVNFPHVKEQLATVASHFKEPMVLDGEIMSDSFQDLMKQIHRKTSAKANDAVLYLFDIITLAEFEAGVSNTPQYIRSTSLQHWYKFNEHLPNVDIVDFEAVKLDTPEGQQRYKEINQLAIDGGYEGIMLKDPKAPYQCKRTASWLKLKPFIEVTLSVVSIEEGTGKNVGKMGALLCEGVDDGKRISVSVGGGYSDEQRADIWNDRDAVIGQLVEVRADALTLNQDSTDVWSMRFPRFKTFRGFNPGEKL